jgi:hypothetical protein
VDNEDLNTLGQMIELGTQYIAEQDENADQVNVQPMQQALEIITGLIPYEVSEVEPADEPDDE